METLEAIQKRRSVRQFTGEIIPREHLEKIVDAGRLAATGSNRQPWDFIVVTDQAMIEQLTVVGKWMRKAGAIIVVVLDPYSRWWLEDGSAAIQNMLIASTALGYGSCWVEGDALPCEEAIQNPLVHSQRETPAGPGAGRGARGMANHREASLESVLHWQVY